jgi:transposase
LVHGRYTAVGQLGERYGHQRSPAVWRNTRSTALSGHSQATLHEEGSKRQLIDGIRWRTRTGAPWRDVPARYGPWQTVYGLFRRWQRDGTWQQILTALQAQADAQGLITWEVSVDSTIARAHQHAAGARKRGPANAKNRAESTSSPKTTGLVAPGAG